MLFVRYLLFAAGHSHLTSCPSHRDFQAPQGQHSSSQPCAFSASGSGTALGADFSPSSHQSGVGDPRDHSGSPKEKVQDPQECSNCRGSGFGRVRPVQGLQAFHRRVGRFGTRCVGTVGNGRIGVGRWWERCRCWWRRGRRWERCHLPVSLSRVLSSGFPRSNDTICSGQGGDSSAAALDSSTIQSFASNAAANGLTPFAEYSALCLTDMSPDDWNSIFVIVNQTTIT